MRRPWLVLAALAVALVALMGISGAVLGPYRGGGWGLMGPTMMGSGNCGGYGAPFMHPFAPGLAAPGWSATASDLDLSKEKVTTYFERWLAWQGNPRLKVGEVKDKDSDTILADIVTKDSSLVQRFRVDRHDGYVRPAEE